MKWADGLSLSPCYSTAKSDATKAWELLKPDWQHSVCEESDYKSPLEALRQGFLMEQNFLDVTFLDEFQRFEPVFALQSDVQATDDSSLPSDFLQRPMRQKDGYPETILVPDHEYQRVNIEMDYDYLKKPNYMENACAENLNEPFLQNDIAPDGMILSANSYRGICFQDFETLCMELKLDEEVLTEDHWPFFNLESHTFCVSFSKDIGLQDTVFCLKQSEFLKPQTWQFLLQHVLVLTEKSLRIFRVHNGMLPKLLGIHQVLVTTSCHQIPGLISCPAIVGSSHEVVDLADFETTEELTAAFVPQHEGQHFVLWKKGCPISQSHLVGQCGTLIALARRAKTPRTSKVGEEDVIEPPRFDFDMDEPVVPAEDVRGRDNAIALIPDDEDVLVGMLSAYTETGSVNLIMFGHDGNYVGRRDAEASPATFEAIQQTVEETWRDYESHFVKVTLVQPQPPELVDQGLVFVVALQHVFAGQPNPPVGFCLCLAGIQLSYAGGTRPEIHRALVVPETFDAQELRFRLQINDICQPHGRRECAFQYRSLFLEEGQEQEATTGAYFAALIGEEKQIFSIRNACRDLDSIMSDLHFATQDNRIRRIRLTQYGHRFRPLGKVNHEWQQSSVIDEINLARIFAEGWLTHPLDRMKIHRARALDAVDEGLGVLTLHFLVSFDLVPGHSICLLMSQASIPRTISGPHLLQPHFWEADSLMPNVRSPLTAENYEILLHAGRVPTLTAVSGDVLQYVDLEDAEPSISPEERREDESEDVNLLQSHASKPSPIFVSEHLPPECFDGVTNVRPPFPIAVGRDRAMLQLFPLLEASLPFDLGQPVPEPTIEEFVKACSDIQPARYIPEEVFALLKPISQAYLETCAPFQDQFEEYHIYTDGSSCMQAVEGHRYREASWAAAIFRVSGEKRDFHGWLGGIVSVDQDEKSFIGANAKNAMDAERSAIFWSLAWCLSLPANSRVTIFADNQAACFGASGSWQINLQHDLAVRIRELAVFVESHCLLHFEHVKAHTLQPQNELADVFAGMIAEDHRCFPHRKTRSECQVAAFRNYKMLWFWKQKGKSLPAMKDDLSIEPSTLTEPQMQPSLLRDEHAFEETEDSGTAFVDLQVATYNVLTLKPFEKDVSVDQDSAYCGKATYLQKQMDDSGLCVLAIQEGRNRESGIFENADAIRVVAQGTPAGTHGVELWLSKRKAFGRFAKKHLHFERARITVRFASPTLLVVGYALGHRSLLFVVCHAPQTGQDEAARAEWWKALSEYVGRVNPNDVLFVLGGFNARLPIVAAPYTGDLVCAKGNGNTQFLLELLQNHSLFAPSTFRAFHHGPIETWQHSSGHQSRLDYIFIREEQWSFYASSAWPRLDAGNAVPDHFAVGLSGTR